MRTYLSRLRLPLAAGALILGLSATGALAQVETREGIALQNQILQLRQEIEVLRRGGLSAPVPGGGSALGAPQRAPAAGQAPQAELLGQLLDRVSVLEQELRSVRGRAEQAEFREQQLRQRVEKLEGDLDFRLRAIEERGQQGAAPAARPPAAPAPAAAAGPRPPQRALADGQAALSRREFQVAEAAAREVIAARDPARRQDAQILLGDALSGRRDFAGAAVAYDDAFRANRQSGRAPEAMLGIANALLGLGNAGDSCAQLNQLRSQFPNLSGAVADRAAETRRRAQCR